MIAAVEEGLAATLTDAQVAFRHCTRLEPACRHALRARGKRLRPTLLHEAAEHGEGRATAVRNAATAVELLHAASLAHDDVIDRAGCVSPVTTSPPLR